MQRSSMFFLLAVSLSVSAYACSDDDTKATPTPASDGGSDTGTSNVDAGGGSDAAQSTDSGTATETGTDAAVAAPCSDSDLELPANDFRGVDAGGQGAGGADVSFPTDPSPSQYVNRCVKIKVGQEVTFAGAFSIHPLQAYGGTTPSPIPALTNTDQDGGALTITFTSPGTFGYRCQIHPTLMNGAVKVVP